MTQLSSEPNLAPQRRHAEQAVFEVGLIFLVFFIQAGWPVPDVNEPHYLGKAKHFWDPAWAAGDFFLGTADAHTVFYLSCGWLTLWLPLAAVGWVGRSVTWLLLAWSWRRLSIAVQPRPFFSVLSAALFVTLLTRFSLAGEWVVGGFEAKGFAYVLVFMGLESLLRDRWGRALVYYGGAAAFHVVVGGWAVLATAITWFLCPSRPKILNLMPAAVLGGALSLGGLVPGLQLTWDSDPNLVQQANGIYVFGRLTHHLLPQAFPPLFIVRHLAAVFGLVVLIRAVPDTERLGRLRRFVAASVAIAATGFVIGIVAWWEPNWAARLLRFYWFRLADVTIPLAVSLYSAVLLSHWQHQARPKAVAGLSFAILIATVHLTDTLRQRLEYLTPRADWTLPRIAIEDWRDVAQWAKQETPPGTVFLVPRLSQTFRWYSGRGEVVTRKDLPQDAASIVEWWHRLAELHGDSEQALPGDSLADLGADRLCELGEKYGASYVVTRPDPYLGLVRVGPETRTVAVYQLPTLANTQIIRGSLVPSRTHEQP